MKLLVIKIAILLFILCESAGYAAIIPIKEEKMAVFMAAPKFKPINKFTPKNFQSSLQNHLEFLLWHKGWKFEMIEFDKRDKFAALMKSAASHEFDFLLYLEPEVILKSNPAWQSYTQKDSSKICDSAIISLELKVLFTNLNDNSGKIDTILSNSETLYEWIKISDSIHVLPDSCNVEPWEFTIMRLIGSALSFLPTKERSSSIPDSGLPIYMVVDSKILNDWQTGSDSVLMSAFDFASYLFKKQFGCELKLYGKNYFTSQDASLADIPRLFKSFAKTDLFKADTITLCLFRPKDIEKYYLGKDYKRIGLSDILSRISVISELWPPNNKTLDWKGFITGQLIFHEICHLMGGIHVFDLYSPMTEKRNWVAPLQFDSLNTFIIRKNLADISRLKSANDYGNFLVEAIESTKYRLSDYPAVFASLINAYKDELKNANFGNSAFATSIPFAAMGYKYIMEGKSDSAKGNLLSALSGAPDQASIHYYLSHVIEGKQAQYHLKKALDLGLYFQGKRTIGYKK
jgi:hypothetical protein